MEKKRYSYRLPTSSVWCAWDMGTVEATSQTEALKLAKEKIKKNFKLANKALEMLNATQNFYVDYDPNQIQIWVNTRQ